MDSQNLVTDSGKRSLWAAAVNGIDVKEMPKYDIELNSIRLNAPTYGEEFYNIEYENGPPLYFEDFFEKVGTNIEIFPSSNCMSFYFISDIDGKRCRTKIRMVEWTHYVRGGHIFEHPRKDRTIDFMMGLYRHYHPEEEK